MSRKTRRSSPTSSRRAQQTSQSLQLEVFESKVNPAYAGIVSFGDAPQPHMMPKNYKSYAQEGYRGNDTLFKVINYIITNGAAIPPVLFTDATMKTKIEKHPLLDKLARPNIEQTGVTYRKAVLGYFLVAGNSYQYAIRKNPVGPPDELWTLQPDKVEINPSKTRGVVSYNFTDFDGDAQHPAVGGNPILAANICHLKTWAPDDPLFGVSPIEVGAIKVDQQSAAQKWNLGLLQNGGKLSGAFTTPIILSPNDRKKTEDRLNEKIAGPRNAGKFAVLDGGLTWNQMGMPPAQMDWLPGIQYNGGQLANLYNMPPQLTGDTSSTTYDNMEQAKAASYTEEIFPVLDDLYAAWNMWLVPMYADLCDATGKPKACLYYDKETVEVVQNVIQAQKTAKAARAVAAWSQGPCSSCTLNQALVMQDLPEIGEDGDIFRFGAILVRVSELGKYADQSLQKPAAPPLPIPEPELNLPPSGGSSDDPTNNPAKPPAPATADNASGGPAPVPGKPGSARATTPAPSTPATPKKSLDGHGVYQPDNLQEELDVNYANGVTHARWMCGPNPCPICAENDTIMVELGDPFPSGHILPPAHPHCGCTIVTFATAEYGKSAGGLIAYVYKNGHPSTLLSPLLLALDTAHRSEASLIPQRHDDLPSSSTDADNVLKRKQARDEYKQFIDEVVMA